MWMKLYHEPLVGRLSFHDSPWGAVARADWWNYLVLPQ
jgi:hypothetical protein